MSQQGPNPIEAYEGAVQAMQPVIAGVTASQLSGSTPCVEWTVQELITHNLKVSQFVNSILAGTEPINPMEVSGALPPEGAGAAFEAITNSLLVTAKATDLEKIVQTPFGEMPAGHFLMVPMADIFLHKWDLAKATNQDTSLDSSLSEVCIGVLTPALGMGREQGFFGAEISVPSAGSAQDRLLGISGRQP